MTPPCSLSRISRILLLLLLRLLRRRRPRRSVRLRFCLPPRPRTVLLGFSVRVWLSPLQATRLLCPMCRMASVPPPIVACFVCPNSLLAPGRSSRRKPPPRKGARAQLRMAGPPARGATPKTGANSQGVKFTDSMEYHYVQLFRLSNL